MTNPMFNPQPNYSGVTIQIANPAVNVGQPDGRNIPAVNSGYIGVNPNCLPNYQVSYPQGSYLPYAQGINAPNGMNGTPQMQPAYNSQYAENPIQNTGYPNAYPAQYYLNNYNYAVTGDGKNLPKPNNADLNGTYNLNSDENGYGLVNNNEPYYNGMDVKTPNQYKMYADERAQKNSDMSKSDGIKEDLAEREAELLEEKKNTKETKIVALTDEYIKSLENYLNNPNDEIRLMASKEILTRLDEDKDRYDDAALNALLNKMMQDPNKLVRIAALSAFSSQLASGNDYTVKLLHNIQSNPNSDKEDVLQAADILLKMSAGVEVKNIPNPSVKDKQDK